MAKARHANDDIKTLQYIAGAICGEGSEGGARALLLFYTYGGG